MVDDQSSAPSDSQSPQAPSLSSSPTVVSNDQSADADTNRPDSPKMADSESTQSQPVSEPPETNRPESSLPADLSAGVQAKEEASAKEGNLADDQPKEATPSAKPEPIEPNSFTPSQNEGTVSANPLSSPNLPNTPNLTNDSTVAPSPPALQTAPAPDLSIPSDLSDISDVNTGLVDNQAPQVQSEAPDNALNNSSGQSQDQSASFKPEPLESPTIPSTPGEFVSSPSPTVSFGDLIKDINPEEFVIQPSPVPTTPPPIASSNSQPTTDNLQPISPSSPLSPSKSETPPSPQNPVSFGDLIKDIDITPPNIPEANRPVEQQQPVPPSQPQPQVSSQVIENIIEKPVEVIKEVIKEVPVEVVKEVVKEAQPRTEPTNVGSGTGVPIVNQEEVERQTSQKLRDEQTTRRVLANQVRAKKKQDNINKILELVRTKGKINNQDVRDLLHVSQSSATNYFTELVNRGMLKIEKHAKATFYTI